MRAAFREAEVAEVLDVRVDVGSEGRQVATLRQIAGFPCRQYVRMKVEMKDGEDAEGVLRGLELTVAVTDAAAGRSSLSGCGE